MEISNVLLADFAANLQVCRGESLGALPALHSVEQLELVARYAVVSTTMAKLLRAFGYAAMRTGVYGTARTGTPRTVPYRPTRTSLHATTFTTRRGMYVHYTMYGATSTGLYTPKSNTRNRTPGTICAENAVSCI
eukprot:1168353-Rhodomonas_salina.1